MIFPLRKYNELKEDFYVIDTCVWIHINSPLGSTPQSLSWAREYSQLLKNLMLTKKTIVFPFPTISEYVNRVIRWGFQQEQSKGFTGDFKDFRKSQHSQKYTTIALDFLKSIYSIGQPVSLGFEGMGHPDFHYSISGGGIDINDRAISIMCKKNNFALVTHDRDFISEDIPILTCNRKMLSTP